MNNRIHELTFYSTAKEAHDAAKNIGLRSQEYKVTHIKHIGQYVVDVYVGDVLDFARTPKKPLDKF